MISAVKQQSKVAKKLVRAAIYTRKSTDEGLEQDFNSLDSQRESGEAYVKSQKHELWECSDEHFDDGGYTGANMDRPALQRLIAKVKAGQIDVVVVYKIDRLSRSLLDFAKLLEIFDQYGVAVVSVTQAFSTTSSTGRLTLNILLSFAQFEREMISERTRDKIAAMRRKGKYCGGLVVLGYDVDPRGPKLVVNSAEAPVVRSLFDSYLKHGSLLAVVQDAAARGIVNKRWTTKNGKQRGGRHFTKTNLHLLLTNVVYAGKVRYKSEVHPGEHEPIIDAETFDRVQALLKKNGRNGGAGARNSFAALLKGLLFCTPCGCAMTPTHTKKGATRYRYYVCLRAQGCGRATCPSKSIPAGEIERFVVDQIRAIGRDPQLVRSTIERANAQLQASVVEAVAERQLLERDLARRHAELRQLLTHVPGAGEASPAITVLVELQERIHTCENRLAELQRQIAAGQNNTLDAAAAAESLAAFDPVWNALTPREQVRIVQLLVARVDYDGAAGKIAITFHPHGIGSLAAELAERRAGGAA